MVVNNDQWERTFIHSVGRLPNKTLLSSTYAVGSIINMIMGQSNTSQGQAWVGKRWCTPQTKQKLRAPGIGIPLGIPTPGNNNRITTRNQILKFQSVRIPHGVVIDVFLPVP